MKFRVIKDENGMYKVQRKDGFFEPWETKLIEARFFQEFKDATFKGSFGSYSTEHQCIAEKFMQHLINEQRVSKKSLNFKVILEQEV